TPMFGNAAMTSLRPSLTSFCGRVPSGQPFCWGSDGFGQLGDGTTTSQSVMTPVRWVEGTAGVPVGMTINGGNNQSAAPSNAVPTAPSVVVRDFAGTPVVGTSVTFAPASGGGSVSGSPSTSNASGIASPTTWVLGSVPGTNTLTASVSNTPTTLF